MKFLPRNTLAAYEAAAQKTRINLSSRHLSLTAVETKRYREDCGTVSPDVRALEFYAMNHYYSMVSQKFTRNEVLPAWAIEVCEGYERVLIDQGYRLMHYIICIIAREARHTFAPTDALMGKLKVIGGDQMNAFLALIRNSSESEAVNSYMNKTPDVPIGPYVRSLECVFDSGKWSSSYGGKPWGQIARTLGDFLYGKVSLEMMCDTAYTLAHNNGPMFNKGMMYDMYGSKEGFMMILDVQASGQIPELILARSKYPYLQNLSMPGLVKFTELMLCNLPDEFGIEVDWQKVEDAQAHKEGQKHSYSHFKSKMKVKPEDTAKYTILGKGGGLKKQEAPVPETLLFPGKTMKLTGVIFEVTPDEYVNIYERVQA